MLAGVLVPEEVELVVSVVVGVVFPVVVVAGAAERLLAMYYKI